MMTRTLVAFICYIALAASIRAQQPGLAYLAESDREGPVTLIDLVKFKPGGEASYEKYDALAEKKLTSLEGEVTFRGSSIPIEGRDYTSWDRVTLRSYFAGACL